MYAAHAPVSPSLVRVLPATTSACAFLASLPNFASAQSQTVVGVGLPNLIEKLTNTKNTVYCIELTDRSCPRIFCKPYLKISPETSRSECFVHCAYVSTKARVCFHMIFIGSTIWTKANSLFQYLLVTLNLSKLSFDLCKLFRTLATVHSSQETHTRLFNGVRRLTWLICIHTKHS